MTLIERLRSGEPYDSLVKEAVADRLEQAEKVIAELEDCLSNCIVYDNRQSLYQIAAWRVKEALASAKSWKEKV